MKKVLLFLLLIASTNLFAQKNIYKIGIITPLPVDIYENDFHLTIASSFFTYEKKVKNKFNFIANSGYLRFVKLDENYSQIPILIGTKYNVNNQFYFGASFGISIYNKKSYGNYTYTYSPFLGINFKNISVETRYFNSINSNNPPKFLSLVFNYS